MTFIRRVTPVINELALDGTLTRRTEQHIKLKKELINWLASIEWTHFITLNTNQDYQVTTMQAKLKRFHSNMTSRLFRNKGHTNEQWLCCVFIEYDSKGFAHFHLLLKICQTKTEWMLKILETQWLKQAKHGSVDIQQINRDKQRVVEYVTKHVDKPCFYNNWLICQNSPLVKQ
jgi:hypothetical protein